ncbi:MAG: glycoside hydrolase family 127 protein [Clostridia bacterium]|nr:glycoside hydrolase family 127 protein [Clostridia bacterium]
MDLKTYYTENRQYGNRFETDAQLIDFTGAQHLTGVLDRHARFVEEAQLFNAEDWHLFVQQFTAPVDDHDSGWRGEYFGKMMRGACMTWQYTKNEELYALLQKVALEMLETQDENGRFSTYSVDFEFHSWDLWSRKYVLLGLLHFHEICRDAALKARIITALCAHLDYIAERIGHGKLELQATSTWWGGINSASILEPVMKMYNITGYARYLDFARYILDFLLHGPTNILTLAMEDKIDPYQYPVTKAYEMMSCFEGVLEYYRVTGEEKYKEAVIRFADRVFASDITLIGCAGCEHELFNHSAATQTDTDYTGIMQETCVTVTWMKLCNQLFLLTGDPKYADHIEQSMYNALHGAVNTAHCTTNGGFVFDSYSPLTLGVRGRKIGGYKDIAENKYYGCCAAIGAAGTALPVLTAVTTEKTGIRVNYYEAGTVCVGGFRLQIDTAYPADGEISITVLEAPEIGNTIALRIPGFAGVGAGLTVNGEALPCEAGTYAAVSRIWKAGDRIALHIDMNAHILRPCGVEGKPETKDYLAVQYGPLVLARDALLSPAGGTVPLADTVIVVPTEKQNFPCTFRAAVTLGDETLDMIDYASAGKGWDPSFPMEAWMKVDAPERIALEPFYKMVKASNRRFPKGVEPYQMTTRLLEECGEIAAEINLWEDAGIKRQKHGDPKKENIANEIRQAMVELAKIAVYYHVEEELEASIRTSLARSTAEGLIG